jgi:hypothetical protein
VRQRLLPVRRALRLEARAVCRQCARVGQLGADAVAQALLRGAAERAARRQLGGQQAAPAVSVPVAGAAALALGSSGAAIATAAAVAAGSGLRVGGGGVLAGLGWRGQRRRRRRLWLLRRWPVWQRVGAVVARGQVGALAELGDEGCCTTTRGVWRAEAGVA